MKASLKLVHVITASAKVIVNINNKLAARHNNKPRPCCHLANDTDLLTPVLRDTAGDWPADPFTRIDPKFNQVVPWSVHTFPENFMQIGPAVFS